MSAYQPDMDNIIPHLLFVVALLCTLPLAVAAEPAQPAGGVVAEEADGVITVKTGGREVLRYRGKPGGLPAGYDESILRGGYIEAVYTPAGVLVSDDYPPDHKHHHGIWSPWTKTVFEGRHPDFWNMGDKTGKVE